jgi:AcrR family transcriptional regulator
VARPRSGDKRRAILEAALRVCAVRGIGGAPTSAISREAGVAEGSLFTYFKTKDELFDELYHELRLELSRHMHDFPREADARERLRYIWEKFLDLGAAHPEQLKVLSQLRASGKLSRGDETPSFALTEVMRATLDASAANELRNVPPAYLVLMVRSQMEITVEFINAHPEAAALCREVGFEMLWRGLKGS